MRMDSTTNVVTLKNIRTCATLFKKDPTIDFFFLKRHILLKDSATDILLDGKDTNWATDCEFSKEHLLS